MKLVHFLKSHVQFTVFLVLALLIGGVAVFAPAIAPADPYEAVMDNSLLPPDGQHLCGTDKLGRDVLSRVGVELADHIIFTDDDAVSLRDSGFFSSI